MTGTLCRADHSSTGIDSYTFHSYKDGRASGLGQILVLTTPSFYPSLCYLLLVDFVCGNVWTVASTLDPRWILLPSPVDISISVYPEYILQ